MDDDTSKMQWDAICTRPMAPGALAQPRQLSLKHILIAPGFPSNLNFPPHLSVFYIQTFKLPPKSPINFGAVVHLRPDEDMPSQLTKKK